MDERISRFGGIARLYGEEGLARLRQAHVAVIGLGGVGSWAVEALARSAVGTLTLIDPDDLCVSNTNRQIHALEGNYGQLKAEVLEARARAINPEITIHALRARFRAKSADELLGEGYDYLFDAIDSLSEKCLLLASCRERRQRVITCGGAGGRRDPSQVLLKDLSQARDDPLLRFVRKKLRREYGFPRETRRKFHIPCVYSPEPIQLPQDGEQCEQPSEPGERALDCESGYGTVSFLTGTFGFYAAAHIVGEIAAGPEA